MPAKMKHPVRAPAKKTAAAAATALIAPPSGDSAATPVLSPSPAAAPAVLQVPPSPAAAQPGGTRPATPERADRKSDAKDDGKAHKKTRAKAEGKADDDADKGRKPKKPKLVRDSFTIPQAEYVVLDALKDRAARLGRPTKKSELLRAGVKALAAMDDGAFLAGVGAVPAVKTGRPPAK